MKQAGKTILFILTVILPFIIIGSITFCIPKQYSNTFLAGLSVKYHRLKSIDQPKIVVIGGSNVAFGLDSLTMEKYTGFSVVNFGLYATLGTKAMLDLSKSSVNKGDIIVISPETDAQTMSLYYNGESMWQALDGDYGMLWDVGFDNFGPLLGAFFSYSNDKLNFYLDKSMPDPKGVYKKTSFNKLGDIIYERPYNSMLLHYDPTHQIMLDPSIVQDDFIEYLNRYAKYVRNKGAKIYFSFPPMNRLALEKGSTEASIYSFYEYLRDKLDFEIISDINDYILDKDYFYDTNFHLNDTGVRVRTSMLAGDILRYEGNASSVELDLPPAPIRPANYFETVEEDDTSGYFIYKDVEGGGITLTDISDLGKSQTELKIPSSYEGKPILSIEPAAFSKCTKLKRVIIGKNTNLKQLYNGVFAGCTSLEIIEIHVLPNALNVGFDLFKGASDTCKVYVHKDMYGDFATDYIWIRLMDRVEILK